MKLTRIMILSCLLALMSGCGRDRTMYEISFEDDTGAYLPITAVAYDDDGSRIAIATYGQEENIYIVDSLTGDTLVELAGASSEDAAITFVPKSDRILVMANSRTTLWEISTKKEVFHVDQVSGSAVISPDGKTVAINGGDSLVVLDMKSGDTLLDFHPGRASKFTGTNTVLIGDSITSMAYSRDANVVVTAGPQMVVLDIGAAQQPSSEPSGAKLVVVGNSARPITESDLVSIAQAGGLILADDNPRYAIEITTSDSELSTCDYAGGFKIVNFAVSYDIAVKDLADSSVLGQQSFHGDQPPHCPDTIAPTEALPTYTLPSGGPIAEWLKSIVAGSPAILPGYVKQTFVAYPGGGDIECFNPAGSYFVTSGRTSDVTDDFTMSLEFWGGDPPTSLSEYSLQDRGPASCSSDGELVAGVTENGLVLIWDTTSMKQVSQINFSDAEDVLSLAFVPGSHELALVTKDHHEPSSSGQQPPQDDKRHFRLFDAETGSEIMNFVYEHDSDLPVLSPDGKHMIVYGSGTDITSFDISP